MRRISYMLSTVIVMAIGLIMLLGLLAPENTPLGVIASSFGVTNITQLFLRIVAITVAFTVIIGIFNLLVVHAGRIRARRGGWGYSIVLIVSLVSVVVITLLERANILNTQPALTTVLLENVQVSIESALSGLLLFALVYGAYRALHNKVTVWGLLFVGAMLIVLVGALSLPGLETFAELRAWIMAVPVSAGARGILLGIALATLVTGVRVLIGQDRSYRE